MPHRAFDGTACRLQRTLALGLLLCLGLGASARAADLTVWSALPKAELAPVLEAYRTASGQEANLVEAPFPELLARYLATPAAAKPDLLLCASVQDLASAAAAGLLDVLDPTGPAVALPEMWRDPGRRWLALAYRPLGLVYAAERVNPESLNTYEALAESRWKGRLALPSGRDPGLLTLAGFFKARYGAANAQALLAAYAANLARPAAGGPQEALATVDAGAADVALADIPALARYLSAHPKSRLAVFWPNQHAEGALATVAAAGLPSGAPHPEAGAKLMSWLASEAGQKSLAAATLAYPVLGGVPAAPLPTSFGAFRLNLVPVEIYGRLEPEATVLLTKAGLAR
jgi:iron(III) transport system substrate-binding protein